MNEVYEYRRAPSKGVIWLCGIKIAVLLWAVTMTDAEHLIWLIWALAAMMLLCMTLPKPIAGIRVDDDHLTLSAWRKPRPIPLDNIAYLRTTSVSSDSDVTIVYKDGRDEGAFVGDMPDIDTLSFVMASRGVPVRDIY